jgi:hypothetical protein
MNEITTQIIVGKTRSLRERVANENLAFKSTNRNHIVVAVSLTNKRRGGRKIARVYCDLFNTGTGIRDDNPGLEGQITIPYPLYKWENLGDTLVQISDRNCHFVFGVPEEHAEEFARTLVDRLVRLLAQQSPITPWPGSKWEMMYVEEMGN